MDENFKVVKGFRVKKHKSDLEKRLTREEVERLLTSLTYSNHKAYWKRNRAVVELLLNTGLRVGELAGLKVFDVLTVSNKIKIVLDIRAEIAKRKKPRQVPLNSSARYAIRVLLGIDHLPDQETQTQFYGTDPSFTYAAEASFNDALVRKPGGRPLSKRSIQEVVTLAALKAGIDRLVGAHVLRHTCLSTLYERTLNLKVVQKIAGHSNSVLTANFYVHPTLDGLSEAMKLLDTPPKLATGE